MPTSAEEVHPQPPFQSRQPAIAASVPLGAALQTEHFIGGLEQVYALDQQGHPLFVWPEPESDEGGGGGPGPTGPQGPAGLGFTPRGAWAPGTTYAGRDVVTHEGQTYEAPGPIAAASFFDPGAWNLWAARGADGSPGAAGSPGATGATGAAGSPGATGATGPAGADGGAGLTGDCLDFPLGQEICGDEPNVIKFHMDGTGARGDPDAIHQMDDTGYELPAGHRLEQTTVLSALPNPTTPPTLSAVSPSTPTPLPAGTYHVVYAWNNDWGSTVSSPSSTITISAGQGISASSPTLPSGASTVSYFFT